VPNNIADKYLRERGLTLDTCVELLDWKFLPDAKAAGYGRHSAPALLIPYLETDYWLLRYLPPVATKDKKGKAKLQRFAAPNSEYPRVYFPPTFDWKSYFAKPPAEREPCSVTEGPVKAAALCAQGRPCVALSGANNYCSDKDGVALIPDLLPLRGTKIELVPDNDFDTNAQVARSWAEFGKRMFRTLGCSVSLRKLPAGEAKGLDDYLKAHGLKKYDKLPVIAPFPPLADEGMIVTNDPTARLHSQVDKMEEALIAAPKERLMMFGGKLVRVIQYRDSGIDAAKDAKMGITEDPLAAVTVRVGAAYLGDALSRTEKVVRFNAKRQEYQADDPDPQWAYTLLARTNESPELVKFPRLSMISYTPILLADGMIVSENGYHHGIWIDTNGVEFDEIPAEETLSQKAAQALMKPFTPLLAEFPFENEESRAVVIADILTHAGRNLFSTVPLFAFSANKARTGKTHLARMAALAMYGMHPATMTFKDKVEFDKHMPVLISRGCRSLLVDNVSHEFDSDQLNACLTTDAKISFRILGASEIWDIPLRAVVSVSGNNLAIAGDMTGRAIQCRLVTEEEYPNRVSHGFDPEARALREFPQLLPIVLRVLRAFLNTKPKPSGRPFGSFEEWDRIIRGCVLWLGYKDPVSTQSAIVDGDPDRERKVGLLSALFSTFKGGEFTSRLIAHRCTGACLLTTSLTDPKGVIDVTWIGKRLSKLKDDRVGGYVLKCLGENHEGQKKWQVETYTVEGKKARKF
jgi:hypothetical protein